MIRRLGFLILVFLAFSASAAVACNEPSLGLLRPSARAGDSVSFSAVHVDPGASYTVLLNGQGVAEGAAGDGPVGGSFTMPDLGRAGTYYVELHVGHDRGAWISSRRIEFMATVRATSVAPQPAPAATPQLAPSSQPQVTVAPKSEPGAPPAPKARSVAPRKTIAAVRATTTTASAAPRLEAAKASPRPLHPNAVKARPTPFAVAPISVDRPPFAPPSPRGDGGVPLWLALVAGVLLMLGAGGAGVLVRSRRIRLRLASMELEAELQEMIAEARAAQAASLRDRKARPLNLR